jgi:hypothetical protein
MKPIESTAQAHAAIESFATKEAKQDTRDCTAMKIGQWARQGDVMMVRIKSVPAAWDVEVKEHNQVALGQTTGSRHCADNAKVFWPKSRDLAVEQCPIPLFPDNLDFRRVALGPVVVASSPEGWTLTHPEHAHHQYGQGIFLAVYQVDYNTKREVRD